MKNERKKLYALLIAVCVVCAAVAVLSGVFSKPEKQKPQEKPQNQETEHDSETEIQENPIEISTPEQEEKVEDELPPFDIPPAQNGATLVFIFDDAGQSADFVREYVSLPFPLAISVLPGLPHTKDCASLIRDSGKELMLHQPMQSENLNLYPGPESIQPEMNTTEIEALIEKNLLELGENVRGCNNHEGSLITTNVVKMGAVLETCRKHGIYFLDSRTTPQTVADAVALEMDIPILERNAPYLDNEIDREKMLSRVYECLEKANKSGVAVIIGHVDKSVEILPALLEQMHPYLVSAGYRFDVPSSLVPKQAD